MWKDDYLENPFCSLLAFYRVDLGDHDGLSMTWPNVTLPKGIQVVLSLLDKNDAEAWSGTVRNGLYFLMNCEAHDEFL